MNVDTAGEGDRGPGDFAGIVGQQGQQTTAFTAIPSGSGMRKSAKEEVSSSLVTLPCLEAADLIFLPEQPQGS